MHSFTTAGSLRMGGYWIAANGVLGTCKPTTFPPCGMYLKSAAVPQRYGYCLGLVRVRWNRGLQGPAFCFSHGQQTGDRRRITMSQHIMRLDGVLNFRDVGQTVNKFLGERQVSSSSV